MLLSSVLTSRALGFSVYPSQARSNYAHSFWKQALQILHPPRLLLWVLFHHSFWNQDVNVGEQYSNAENLDFSDVVGRKPTQEFNVVQGREVGEYHVMYGLCFPVEKRTLRTWFFPSYPGQQSSPLRHRSLCSFRLLRGQRRRAYTTLGSWDNGPKWVQYDDVSLSRDPDTKFIAEERACDHSLRIQTKPCRSWAHHPRIVEYLSSLRL